MKPQKKSNRSSKPPRKGEIVDSSGRRPRLTPRRMIVAIVVVAIAIAIFAWQRGNSKTPVAESTPAQEPAVGQAPTPAPSPAGKPAEGDVFAAYGGTPSCKECHPRSYSHWDSSHHAKAERLVNPAIDRPAFDPPRTIRHGTQISTARVEDGLDEIVTLGLSGKAEPQIVRRVIGVDPLEQFLVNGLRGRMQALELAYDPHKKDWFDVYGDEDRQPGEWGHWTGRGMTWNAMCATCHNTRLLKNYDEASDSYHTKMAEMSVGCEACHGPMKAHSKWQKEFGKPGRLDPTEVHPTRDEAFDMCGSCHARRGELTGDFTPGERFFDHYSLSGVDESDLFYADGQVKEEDYEFSAFLGSKMYAAGVRCIDCHDPHTAKTILEGNALCLRCHSGGNIKAPVINPFTHTFHKPGSAGSQCVNCHMPQTKYMQRHDRHDHGFTTPDPFLTKQLGIPNACNRCHKDKNADWALAAATKWYGAKLERPARQRAMTIAAARRGDAGSKNDLLAMLNDPAASFYWRSAFVRLLGRWPTDPAIFPALIARTSDPSAMVRENATTMLAPMAGSNRDAATAISARLDDPFRNVRIAAAHALGAVVSPTSAAGRDYLACLQNQADQPTGQLQLAAYEAARGNALQAAEHLIRCIAWDPNSAGLRRDAAVLYGSIGRPQDALEQMEAAVRLEPNNAEYAMMLGLAASEAAKPAEALAALERSVQLDPGNARAWYNLALARRDAKQYPAALNAIDAAEKLNPNDADIPYERALLLSQLKRFVDARAAIEKVLLLRPNDPAALDFLRALPPAPGGGQ